MEEPASTHGGATAGGDGEPHYRRLLVVCEERAGAQAALAEAIALAQEQGAELVIAEAPPRDLLSIGHAMTISELGDEAVRAEMRLAAQARLDAALERARSAGVTAEAVLVEAADPATELARAAEARRCDLIVVACEGRNALVRLLSGSLVPGLITATTVPLLVCRDRAGRTGARRLRRRRRRREDATTTGAAPALHYTARR